MVLEELVVYEVCEDGAFTLLPLETSVLEHRDDDATLGDCSMASRHEGYGSGAICFCCEKRLAAAESSRAASIARGMWRAAEATGPKVEERWICVYAGGESSMW